MFYKNYNKGFIMNYTNMLYAAIAGLLVAVSNSHAMESAQEAGSNVYSSETTNTPRPVFIEPIPKPSSKRVKSSLIGSDEKVAQQRAFHDTTIDRKALFNPDDVNTFNESLKPKKSKSSCIGCFK